MRRNLVQAYKFLFLAATLLTPRVATEEESVLALATVSPYDNDVTRSPDEQVLISMSFKSHFITTDSIVAGSDVTLKEVSIHFSEPLSFQTVFIANAY